MWLSLNHFSKLLFGERTKTPRRQRASVTRNRKLQCESLERRELFALLTGETLVNTTTVKDQYDVASATNANGRSVVVWTHQYSNTDTDVYAQRYDAAGNKLGGEIYVATSGRREDLPDVSIDASGDFVIAWRDQVSSSNTNILAQRFSSTGVLRGSVINVASTTKNENAPSIASDANGNFVVAWTSEYDSFNDDLRARRYLDNGSLASSFVVSNSSDYDESYADVAMAPDGRFAISYIKNNGASTVMVKRYSSSAGLVTTHTVSAGTNGRVSMDDNANTFVVYQNVNYDVFVRRISNAGLVGSTITIAKTTAYETVPEVAAKRDGTAFVVTYRSETTSLTDLKVAEFTSSGTLKKRESAGTQNQWEAMPVNFGSGGNYQIFRARYANSTSLYNIYRRKGTLS